jgi:hypothetical protein
VPATTSGQALGDAHLVDFDPGVIDSCGQNTHVCHGIGIRTMLESGEATQVVFADWLRGLRNLLAEAARIAVTLDLPLLPRVTVHIAPPKDEEEN